MTAAHVPAAVVAGVPVDDVVMDDVLDLFEAFVDAGRAGGRTFQVGTVNVDFVVNALQHPDLLDILRRTELSIPDGMPIVWHSRLSRTPLRARVAGADLVPAVVQRGVERGWSIVLFGSAPGVAEQAATRLQELHPGATVCGISGPMMADVRQMEDRWLDEIRAARPDVVFVALGNPKQERWIDTYRDQLGAAVFVGVGGTLDFLVGGRRRAPAWVSRAGLEWLFRAVQEPGRLGRRYGHDARVFGPHLLRAAVARVRQRSSASATSVEQVAGGASDVGATTLRRNGTGPLTSADIALVVGVGRDARRNGTKVTLIDASPALVDIVTTLFPDDVFQLQ